jgi:hypothetical protein
MPSARRKELGERVGARPLPVADAGVDPAAATWYGMPAYADKGGKVVCHFQSAHKFKSRYATLGFSDTAKLDDGNI